MEELFFGLGVGHSIMLVSVVIAVGLWLAKFKFKGVSIGATWILFVGILLGHLGFKIDPELLHFIKEFGLILFVFSIGLQVGPGFFQSFKKGGLTMNLLAIGIVLLGAITTYVISIISGEELTTMVGVMSGAVTNTPGLGAAQQTLTDITKDTSAAAHLASGYAVAYPLGMIGVLLVVMAIKALFKVDLAKEKEALDADFEDIESAVRIACEVQNPAIFGKTFKDLDHSHKFVVSRISRGDKVNAATSSDILQQGDRLLIVTSKSSVDSITMLFGKEIEMDKEVWKKLDTSLVTKKLNVTKSKLTGVKLRDLNIRSNYGVSITRVDRAGVELVANPNLKLQMGDIIVVVGTLQAIDKVADVVGNSEASLRHPNLIPIFFGITLGVIFGSIPIAIPGIPQPIKLGLAGGPLIIAILIGYFGPRLKITTYTTLSANMMIREMNGTSKTKL